MALANELPKPHFDSQAARWDAAGRPLSGVEPDGAYGRFGSVSICHSLRPSGGIAALGRRSSPDQEFLEKETGPDELINLVVSNSCLGAGTWRSPPPGGRQVATQTCRTLRQVRRLKAVSQLRPSAPPGCQNAAWATHLLGPYATLRKPI